MQQGWDEACRFAAQSGELKEALGVGNGATLTVEPLAQGEHNSNFVLSCDELPAKAVLRLNYSSQIGLRNQASYEYEALKALAPSGRVPHALFLDDSKRIIPQGVLVMEFCEGRHLSYDTPGDTDTAAALLADIHSTNPPASCRLLRPCDPLDEQLRECIRLFSSYRAWAHADPCVIDAIESMLQRAQDTLNAMPPAIDRNHILNTEAVSDHFLIPNDPDKARMVDWEKPIVGEAAQDVAYFLSPTTTIWKVDFVFSDNERVQFVQRYWDAVDGRFSRRGFDERFGAYVQTNCLRGITWSAAATVEYRSPHRALKNADTEARLGLYLDRAFLATLTQRFFS